MLNCVFLYLPVVVFSPILHGAPIGVLRKLDRFKQVNIIHTILYGSHTLFLGILLLSDTKNFVLVLLSYAFAEIIESLILFGYAILVMKKTSSLRGFWKAGFARNPRFLKYNVLYGLTTSFDQLLGNVSTLLINRFIGNFATAYLKVITKICGMFTKLTNPLGQIFYPELCSWIAKKDFKKAYRVSFKFQFLICAGGLILTGIMFGTYDLWIQIFDASMVAAKWQSLLYMLFTVLSISMICITQLVFALDLVKGNLVLIIVFNILYVIALIPTIQAFGIYGYLLLQIAQLLLVAIGKILLINFKIKKELVNLSAAN